jgi:hypothetical protein
MTPAEPMPGAITTDNPIARTPSFDFVISSRSKKYLEQISSGDEVDGKNEQQPLPPFGGWFYVDVKRCGRD